MKYEGTKAGKTDILLAIIADRLAALSGAKDIKPIAESLLGVEPVKKKTTVKAFDTPEDFFKVRYGKEGAPCQQP